MRARMKVEFARLREVYGEVEHAEAGGEDWFKIPSYLLPEGWMVSDQSSATVPIVFLVKADYPGGSPYGFLTPVGLNFQGAAPNNTGEAARTGAVRGRLDLFFLALRGLARV